MDTVHILISDSFGMDTRIVGVYATAAIATAARTLAANSGRWDDLRVEAHTVLSTPYIPPFIGD